MATVKRRGGSYSIRVSCGYDVNGKQIIKSMTWKPQPDMSAAQAEKEAQRQAVLFEEKCRTGQVLQGNVRFADFAEIWLRDYAAKQVRATTFDRYKSMLPRINASIGHIRLDRLQPHHLLQFYDNLAETGVREDSKQRFKGDLKAMLRARSTTKTAFAAQAGVSLTVLNSITQGKNVSPESAARVSAALGQPVSALFDPVGEDRRLSAKTILHHHRLISVILQTAVEWQVLFSNPCDRVKPPRVEHKEARYLDEKQAMEVMQALEGEDIQNRTIIKVLLYTGMRRGELCGLTWADIDFEKSIIHIQRSSLYLADKGIFEDETKNATSRRSIKVPTDAMRALQLFQEWQDQQIYLLGDQWQASGRVFTSWNGAPIHPDTVSGWFSHFIEKHNLPDISLHSLRHTNATLLIAAGTNLQTVAARLGQSSINTTAKIYAHAIQAADAAAADTLQDLLHPLAQ